MNILHSPEPFERQSMVYSFIPAIPLEPFICLVGVKIPVFAKASCRKYAERQKGRENVEQDISLAGEPGYAHFIINEKSIAGIWQEKKWLLDFDRETHGKHI